MLKYAHNIFQLRQGEGGVLYEGIEKGSAVSDTKKRKNGTFDGSSAFDVLLCDDRLFL